MAVQKEAGSGDGPDGRMAKRNEIQHTHTHKKGTNISRFSRSCGHPETSHQSHVIIRTQFLAAQLAFRRNKKKFPLQITDPDAACFIGVLLKKLRAISKQLGSFDCSKMLRTSGSNSAIKVDVFSAAAAHGNAPPLG